jgi:hypothetical protein
MAHYSRDKIIEDRTKQIIERYKSAGWKKPEPPKPTVNVNGKDILINNTPINLIIQAVASLAQKAAGLLSFATKTKTQVKVYIPPVIQEEAVKITVKKPIVKSTNTIDDFKTRETYKSDKPKRIVTSDIAEDPYMPLSRSNHAVTFKLKDPNSSIPSSTETFLLGYSRVDGCGIYRHYGQNMDALKQHYNIEELYE